jgi:hypothetical protein
VAVVVVRTRMTSKNLERKDWILIPMRQDMLINPKNLKKVKSKIPEGITTAEATLVVAVVVTVEETVVVMVTLAVAEEATTTNVEAATMITPLKTEEVVLIQQEARADLDVTKILKNKKIKMTRKRLSPSRRE